MFRTGLYARVSTNDQQTLAMQNRAMREYAFRRGWTIAAQVREVNSGAAQREAREKVKYCLVLLRRGRESKQHRKRTKNESQTSAEASSECSRFNTNHVRMPTCCALILRI